LLSNVLDSAKFEKLIYLSSTRVYMECQESGEDINLIVSKTDERKLFNLTKLVSEELCRLSKKNTVIVRPSNVYGLALESVLYLPTITRNAIKSGVIDMYVTPDYSKDYVSVDTVATAIISLALKDSLSSHVYNIGSGDNVSAKVIAKILVDGTNCRVVWHDVDSSKEDKFPLTDISALNNEVEYVKHSIYDDLPELIALYKKAL
jgi:nucleoside-diphosphate-sugar epimerase